MMDEMRIEVAKDIHCGMGLNLTVLLIMLA